MSATLRQRRSGLTAWPDKQPASTHSLASRQAGWLAGWWTRAAAETLRSKRTAKSLVPGRGRWRLMEAQSALKLSVCLQPREEVVGGGGGVGGRGEGGGGGSVWSRALDFLGIVKGFARSSECKD